MKMADMQAVIGELARAEIARQQVTSVSSERLKELKNELYYIDQNRGGISLIDLAYALIDNAMQDRPASDEVPSQLLAMFDLANRDYIANKWFNPHITREDAKLIYNALRQYEPKDGCDWCKEVNGFMRLDSVRYSRCDEIGYDHDVQFPRCPNCGRDLKAGE
jgi:hypothetical protein